VKKCGRSKSRAYFFRAIQRIYR